MSISLSKCPMLAMIAWNFIFCIWATVTTSLLPVAVMMMSALEMTYFGALVHAGSGAVTYHQIADRLSYVVGLILGDDS